MPPMNSKINVRALKGLTDDSRAVKPGWLFAALPGLKTDGRNFIPDALRNGASVILAPRGTTLPEGVKTSGAQRLVESDNPRRELGLLAAKFYKSQPRTIVAVTGTNGKTSVVDFTQQIWENLGAKAASLGTLGVRGAPYASRSGATTPDPVTLMAELADLAAADVTHLAMEASSHGLHQYRLDGVKLSAAAFTNLSRDHLDYHKDMESYLAVKARLFSELLPAGSTAVLNADIPEYAFLRQIAEKAGHGIISYGKSKQAKESGLLLKKITPSPLGQKLDLAVMEKPCALTLPLVGEFQAMNALCAAGLVLAEKAFDADAVMKTLEHLRGVPGRLQLIKGHPKGAAVYVDYAHTPGALESVLETLRPHVSGRLVCLFGCGGDRDRGKRPLMGKIACALADKVIVTDDNPRSEDPQKIRAEILAGAPGAEEIEDRADAIQSAVEELEKGDVLLIAGKGHEQGQIFADHTDPFDDCVQAQKALEGLRNS